MGRLPDSPEGVALALTIIILGGGDLTAYNQPRDMDEVLSTYRKCLAAVRDEEGVRQIAILQDLARQH